MPGFPSVAVERLSVTARSILLGDGYALTTLVLDCGFDFTDGHTPTLSVREFTARERDNRWGADHLTLDVDLEKGILAGSGRASLIPDRWLFFSLDSGGDDRFSLLLAEDEARKPPLETGIAVTGQLSRQGLAVRSITFDAVIRTPSQTELERMPLIARYMDELPALQGLTLAATKS